MYGLTVIEGMSLSGHPLIINKIHEGVLGLFRTSHPLMYEHFHYIK